MCTTKTYLSKNDDFVKSPDAALRCILRCCGVLEVRLIPQNLRALPPNFLQSRLKLDFLREHQKSLLSSKKREESKNIMA